MIPRIKDLFYKYQKNIFSILSNVSGSEYSFITESLNNITEEDITNNQHLSSYSFVISVENGVINGSRFIVGTKTDPNLFQKNATKMLKSLNIKESKPDGFQWYGVGWDIKNDEIKIYFLSKDFSQIFCKEYRRSSAQKLRDKIYQVGKFVTTMNKDGEIVEQINTDSIHHEIVDKMLGLGFNLDTYSEYQNKKTFYFD
ncbi:MAG: hypothetical protein ACO3HJ_00215 [Methylophilaceae bacterium]